MATIRTDVYIDRSPDEVWGVVGDIGGLHKWMPGVETSSLVGDERICEFPDGTGKLVERVISRNEENRRYDYTILEGPMNFDHYRAAMWVEADGSGARFNWEISIEPADAAESMRHVAGAGAQALKAHLETNPGER